MKREGKKISWNLFEKVWFRFADCRRNRSFRKGQFGEQPSFNIYDLKVCIFLLFFFFWREKDSPFVESCWERVNRSRRFTTNTYTPLSRPGIVSDWLLKTYVSRIKRSNSSSPRREKTRRNLINSNLSQIYFTNARQKKNHRSSEDKQGKYIFDVH